METPSILILDAEQHQSLLMARILGRAGLEVVVANDLSEALLVLQTRTFTYVLVDAGAPGRAAHHVLLHLRQQAPQTRCLVSVHERTSRRADEFQALGAWATIQRPLNMDALKSLLTQRPGRGGTGSGSTRSDYASGPQA